jgi:hypothetical protein
MKMILKNFVDFEKLSDGSVVIQGLVSISGHDKETVKFKLTPIIEKTQFGEIYIDYYNVNVDYKSSIKIQGRASVFQVEDVLQNNSTSMTVDQPKIILDGVIELCVN